MDVTTLIKLYAVTMGFDPNLAVSIATIESGLNPKAIGSVGEVGLFQIRPQFVDKSIRDTLSDPHVNITVGIKLLQNAQKRCVHQEYYGWLTCYNAGFVGAKRIKNPSKFPYVKKIRRNYEKSIYRVPSSILMRVN
jgi:soluble lytic murein transglycosylase-like protein